MKLKKKKNLLILAVINLVMSMLITSCGTTKIQKEIIEISFPEFPEIESSFDEDNRTVTIPLDNFLELARFKIRYESTISFYNNVKEIEEKK